MSIVWRELCDEAKVIAAKERILSKVLTECVLERDSFADALSWRLSNRLAKGSVPANDVRELLLVSFISSDSILMQIEADLQAVKERDPACDNFINPFLYFKTILEGLYPLPNFKVLDNLHLNVGYFFSINYLKEKRKSQRLLLLLGWASNNY